MRMNTHCALLYNDDNPNEYWDMRSGFITEKTQMKEVCSLLNEDNNLHKKVETIDWNFFKYFFEMKKSEAMIFFAITN